MASYLDKFQCVKCLMTSWSIVNPLECPRCLGNMMRIDVGTEETDVSAVMAQKNEEEAQETWEQFETEFDKWWMDA